MRLSVSDSCRVSNSAIKSVLVAAGDKLIVASGDHIIIVNVQTLTELVRAITLCFMFETLIKFRPLETAEKKLLKIMKY